MDIVGIGALNVDFIYDIDYLDLIRTEKLHIREVRRQAIGSLE